MKRLSTLLTTLTLTLVCGCTTTDRADVAAGADGNVVSTRARGPQLRKELESLLGPIEEKAKVKEEPDTTE